MLNKSKNYKLALRHELLVNVSFFIEFFFKSYKFVENLKKLELEGFIDGSGGRQDVNRLINEETDKIMKYVSEHNVLNKYGF